MASENLTDQNVTAGSAPAYHVTYNPANNRINGESADANGNLANYLTNGYPYYDVENRMAAVGYLNVQYSYAAGNKRVWRGFAGRRVSVSMCSAIALG